MVNFWNECLVFSITSKFAWSSSVYNWSLHSSITNYRLLKLLYPSWKLVSSDLLHDVVFLVLFRLITRISRKPTFTIDVEWYRNTFVFIVTKYYRNIFSFCNFISKLFQLSFMPIFVINSLFEDTCNHLKRQKKYHKIQVRPHVHNWNFEALWGLYSFSYVFNAYDVDWYFLASIFELWYTF